MMMMLMIVLIYMQMIEAILQETSRETRSEAEPISESVNIAEVKDQGFDSKFPQAY